MMLVAVNDRIKVFNQEIIEAGIVKLMQEKAILKKKKYVRENQKTKEIIVKEKQKFNNQGNDDQIIASSKI